MRFDAGFAVRVTRLDAADVALVAAIDRAEDVEREYQVVAGALVARPVTVASIAPWDPAGADHHSVAEEVAFVTGHLDAGATLLGAFVDPTDPGELGANVGAGAVAGVRGRLADPSDLADLGDPGDPGDLAGLAVVQPCLDGDLAQLAFLHVSRPHRRRGAAGALWVAAVEIARGAGATALYVSATPTGSAVGFYLSRGCDLARPPRPDLLAAEPDDIHLVCPL